MIQITLREDQAKLLTDLVKDIASIETPKMSMDLTMISSTIDRAINPLESTRGGIPSTATDVHNSSKESE